MSDERCLHDLIISQCGTCTPRAGAIDLGVDRRGGGIGNSDATLKHDSLSQLCSMLGMAPLAIGVGSSVPSEVFDAMVARTGVPSGSMPDVGRAVATKADVLWDASCESTGSTVTGIGLERLVSSLRRLGF